MSSNVTPRDIALLYLSATWSGLVIRNDSYVANAWKHYADFFVSTGNSVRVLRFMTPLDNSYTNNFKNIMLLDLTAMGIDNLTTTAQVEEWLSSHLGDLPYYGYTKGTLIPFNGTGLKTTGKNLLNFPEINSPTNYGIAFEIKGNNIKITGTPSNYLPNIRIYADGTFERDVWWPVASQIKPEKGFFKFPSGTKTLSSYFNDTGVNVDVFVGYESKIGHYYSSNNTSSRVQYLTENEQVNFICFSVGGSTTFNVDRNLQVEAGTIENPTYEPYTSSTINLPTLTYFPTGMKSAGSVYDEQTENKAIQRVGSEDMGNLGWYIEGGNFVGIVTGMKANAYTSENLLCARYVTSPTTLGNLPDKSIRYYGGTNKVIVKDSTYNNATAFQTAMSGIYLYYELATYTETTINTASLVSEQAEIPLYEDDDILIGECTTQLSSESGFIPTKIKYQDDSGVAYSQKINLHVEK